MSATHHKNLRSGQSIWSAGRARIPLAPKVGGNINCDVIVVGAGISGALLAESLAERGLDVVIVDRRKPLSGSTPASTALLQYEIDVPLTDLSRRIGKQRAQRIWRRSRLALDALRERSRRLGIDAGCINRDSLYLEGDVLDEAALMQEAAARREAGFEVMTLDRRAVQKTYGIDGRAAILGFDNLAADPRRLAAGFLRAAAKRRARLFSRTAIMAVHPTASRVDAETEQGHVIRARNLVFTTGYELPKGVPTKGHKIASTWAMATRPQPRNIWRGGCFIWEASDPYLYMRPGPKGCVICGGEDEDFSDEATRDALLPAKIEAIRSKLSKLLPALDTRPEYMWCGNFGASETGTPSIGLVPGMPNCHAVLGYGGNGITFSMMAAQILTTSLTGGTDPDADLFSFTRDF